MNARNLKIGSRHPKAVLIYSKDNNISGVAEILSAHVDGFKAIMQNSVAAEFLIESKPSVVLFALNNIRSCVEYYSQLIEQSALSYPHYTVLLCGNRESGTAFRCCMKGLFDNYFVYQPLYEKYRLAMIVHNGLSKVLASNLMAEFNENNFEEIDNNFAKLIEDVTNCKQGVISQIEQSKIASQDIGNDGSSISAKVNSSNKENICLNPSLANLSVQDIMQEVSENHVKPLLSLLESDIKTGLDSMIHKLLSAQLAAKTQAHVAKELNNHSNTIKPELDKVLSKQNDDVLYDDSYVDSYDDNHDDNHNHDDDNNYNVESVADNNMPLETPPLENKSNNAFNILVVEDNSLYREMLVSVLKKADFIVDQAQDGLIALDKIKNEHFDLIIMDLFMPKLDGLNTTKKIRQISGGRDVPVIALTGNTNKSIIKKWASYGLKGYIIKPSTKTAILQAVGTVFNPTSQSVM